MAPPLHVTRCSRLFVAMAIAVTGAIQSGVAAAPQAPAVSGAYADLAGHRIWYRDSGGTGAPIVLLHAGSGSSLFFDRQLADFGAAGFRVVAYDRLGVGRSTLVAGSEPGTAADDLRALIAHLGLGRVHLVGTAAGGGVAIDFALSFPDSLRSLVVANSIGGVTDPDYVAMGRRMRPPSFNELPVEVRELGPSYRAANPGGVARWVELEHQSAAVARLVTPQRDKNRITFASLETMRVPTLLVTGDADLFTPPAVLRMFAARMPGAETLIVPETGHSAYWEQPETFNRAVLAFIHKH